MKLSEFILLFSEKPKLHGEIWWYILIRYKSNFIRVQAVIRECETSKSSVYRIFNKYNNEIEIDGKSIFFNIANNYIEITQKKPAPKKAIKVDDSDVVLIIEHLNMQSGKNYKHTSKKTIQLIHARLNDGYTLSDFKQVIDTKCIKWLGSQMEDYLRPETLFSNKFDAYLNEQVGNNTNKDLIEKTNDTINKAKQHNWNFDSNNG